MLAEIVGGEVKLKQRNKKVVRLNVKVKLPYGKEEQELDLSIGEWKWDDISEYLKSESQIHLILGIDKTRKIEDKIKGIWLNATEKKSLWIRLNRV